MRFACNLNLGDVPPVEWAARREAEGWHKLMISDHIFEAGKLSPHVWSVLGALATSTTEVRLGTGYYCNLFRHPVEFAQASLSVQQLSGGRFEAGLGAGWAEEEMRRTGRPMPGAPERADRLIEAAQIVREWFDTGGARFEGRYYRVAVHDIGRLSGVEPPPLVVASGGPKVIRAVAPVADKLELIPAARASRPGAWDERVYRSVTADDVRALIDIARTAREDLPLQIHVACRVREPKAGHGSTRRPAESFLGTFFGPVEQVTEALLAIGDLGIDEVYVGPHDEHTYEQLAPRLLTPRSPDVRTGSGPT
jgi:alkanesulfonate monooxygenase SsuD/methylene tetrahydromethanopterin reductase-like flavin-dependent oxidoreductase (luciferase family)